MILPEEKMAGQRLMVGFDGDDLNEDLKFIIRDIQVGGIILFSRNISTPDQVRNLCHSAQAYAKTCGLPPLFISIDQEGGVVARLKEPFTVFEGNPRMADTKDAENFARITATELSNVGINMNMAPVLDVAIDSEQSIMADRVFGSDPQRVTQLGVTVIRHLQKNGIMSVAKHFPGIGRTTLDSHIEQPFIDTDVSIMENSDLLPFAAAIESDVACVMLSHVCFGKFDDRWPASLSRKIAMDLLRRRMGFKGVAMTDDLDMGAIKKRFNIETSINRILHAEIDIALICHRSPDIETALTCVLAFQSASKTRRKTCEQSVNRILKLKKQYLSY